MPLFFSSWLFLCCTLPVTPQDSSPWVNRCASQDLPLSRRPQALAFLPSMEQLYVLDRFSGVSRWDLWGLCSVQWDRDFGSEGLWDLDGFVDDLAVTQSGRMVLKSGGRLSWGWPGDSLLRECLTTSGPWAVSAAGDRVWVESNAGVYEYSLNGQDCMLEDVDVVPEYELITAVNGGYSVWAGVSPVITGAAVYVDFYNDYGALEHSEMIPTDRTPCSVTQLRSDLWGRVFLLDGQCRQIYVFDDDDGFLGKVDLQAAGVQGSVADIASVSMTTLWLLGASSLDLWQVSWYSLLLES